MDQLRPLDERLWAHHPMRAMVVAKCWHRSSPEQESHSCRLDLLMWLPPGVQTKPLEELQELLSDCHAMGAPSRTPRIDEHCGNCHRTCNQESS